MASGPAILVTAFEPFGLIRGHVPGLRGNRSRDILEQLRADNELADQLAFEVLPVSAAACTRLDDRLSHSPVGVLLMGEDLLAGIRLEPRAYDPDAQIGPLRLPGTRWRTSAFAKEIAADMAARGVSTASWIGTYYCNRAYWHALGWSEQRGRPAVFFHVGPRSNLEWQTSLVREALVRMRRAVAAPA
jgi:pyrrolidone-carboxylate peptidase